MGSAFLYLAIVVIWGIVLVPMWLRRDNDGPRRQDEDSRFFEDEDRGRIRDDRGQPRDDRVQRRGPETAVGSSPDATLGPGRRLVLARRRRRTLILSLAVLASVLVAAAGLGPWWVMVPPAVLMAGHLSMLRVAVQVDAERHRAELAARVRAARAEAARAEHEAASARAAEEARAAQVIDLTQRNREREVFDQYTDAGLRAVGD